MKTTLSSVLLLVLAAHLNALTAVASVSKSRATINSQRVPSNSINHMDNKQPISRADNDFVTKLRAGSDASMEQNRGPNFLSKMSKYADKNFFLVGMFLAVALAKIVPSVSKTSSFVPSAKK